MNTLIDDPILTAFREGVNSPALTFGGMLAIALVLLLIFLKEALRARDGERTQVWLEVTDIAILPLMGAAGLVILAHLLNAIRP
jgi:multisubunit Na+/H+ antiporter MnhB subunit